MHLVIPINSAADAHWTVLTIKTAAPKTCEITEVSYCDFCDMKSSSNRRYAELILKYITEAAGVSFSLPYPQSNNFRQRKGSNDCGLAVWYVLESLMKEQRKERPKSLYPDTHHFRHQLARLCTKLRGEKEQWQKDDDSGKPRARIIIPGSVEEDAASRKKSLKDAKNLGAPLTFKTFYGCPSCRWTATSGTGCMYCNPKKHEAALANKRKEFAQVLKAVDDAKKIKSDIAAAKEPETTCAISAAKEPETPCAEVEAQVEV